MSPAKADAKRSDELRRKRSSQPLKSSSTSKGKRAQKKNAPAPPAVLVRGSLAASMVQERRGKKRPKRRYDVALSTPGAEMRLPALPRIKIGWRLVSALLLASLAYLLYTVWNAPTYRVLAAEIKGARRLTSQDVNTVAGIAGKPIFLIEPEVVRQELIDEFPELSAVEVEVALPAKVTVTVEEREPIIVWVQDDQETWVDASGIAFPVRGESDSLIQVNARTSPPGKAEREDTIAEPNASPQVEPDSDPDLEPVMEPETPTTFLPVDMVNAILIMAGEAPEGRPIVYSSDHGFGWEDKRGWEVYFGMDDEDMEMKLRVYQEIARRLKKDGMQPEFISVEFVHAPYYRLDQ